LAIVKRGSNGSYAVVITYKDENGKKKQKWIAAESYTKAQDLERQLLMKRKETGYKPGQKYTVASFTTTFLNNFIKINKRANTFRNYQDVLAKFLGKFGSLPLDIIDTITIQQHLNDELLRGLSPSTVKTQYVYIQRVFTKAHKIGLIFRDPCCDVELPDRNKPKCRFLDPHEVSTLEDITKDSWLYTGIQLGIRAGLRSGESCGLRWEDVDFTEKEAFIRQSLDYMPREEAERRSKLQDELQRVVWWGYETKNGNVLALGPVKTKASRATVQLSDDLLKTLQDEKAKQEHLRATLGKGYRDNGFVWAEDDGRPHVPDSFRKALQRAIKAHNKKVKKDALQKAEEDSVKQGQKKAENDACRQYPQDELPVIHPHELRHTCATLLLRARKEVKLVSTFMRHAYSSFTIDTYQHAPKDLMAKVPQSIDNLISESRKGE
jgi:integrase